jgi:alkylation response protein AidB-like acyl-CoA dehydrogenase
LTVGFKLTEAQRALQCEAIELARSLPDHDLGVRDRVEHFKLYVSESLVESWLHTIQILGDYGYVVEGGAERDVRDAIGSTLYSGTSEIQCTIVANGLGL